MDGEYHRSSGWTYERELIERHYLRSHGEESRSVWTVKARLLVSERPCRSRKARSWSLVIGVTGGGIERRTESRSCRSVSDAMRQADEHIVSFDVAGLIRENFSPESPFWTHVYSHGEHLMSVNDVALVPSGDYVVVTNYGPRVLSRGSSGYVLTPVFWRTA
jgi:hypothetical protein